MDFRFGPGELAFATEVDEFVAENRPKDWKPRGFIFLSEEEWAEARRFDLLLGQRGWLAPHWPTEFGGLGMDPLYRTILAERLALAGAPDGGGRGHGPSYVGPAILSFGTAEQRARYLRPIVEGTEVWAQCFSEVSAGSDMANVEATAERNGDDFVLTGVKLWTGQAHRANHAIVTARTSDGPKHRSISLFLVDLTSDGVEIEPMWTLPRFGRLNRETFRNVRVPADCLLGEEHGAWPIMNHVMYHERGGIANPATAKRILLEMTKDGRIALSASQRHKVVEVLLLIEIAVGMNYRIALMMRNGEPGSYESSVAKVVAAQIHQELGTLITSAYGLSAMHDPMLRTGDYLGDYWLQSVQASIVSGTSEIMRNIIATRGLGLPR